jgi:methylated-DNA-[protein]-cysteine S-methyltransferase
VAVTCVRYEADGWGVGELCTDGRRVLWHELPRPEGASATRAPETPHPHPGRGSNPPPTTTTLSEPDAQRSDDFVPNLLTRLRAFFAGDAVDFADVELDLSEYTPFHRACAHVMRAVPRGEIVTYGELAALAGAPGAARAAGSFCARNRHSVFVPCHRVVGAGGLGGYGSLGASYKRRLLALENVAV